MVIANDGTGTADVGNYTYVISHGGNYYNKRRGPYKKGTVKNFPRKYSPYRLVQRCLKDAGEV